MQNESHMVIDYAMCFVVRLILNLWWRPLWWLDKRKGPASKSIRQLTIPPVKRSYTRKEFGYVI